MPVMMWCYQRTFQGLFCTQRVNTGRDKHFNSNIISSRWSCTSSFAVVQAKPASNLVWKVWASPARLGWALFPSLVSLPGRAWTTHW